MALSGSYYSERWSSVFFFISFHLSPFVTSWGVLFYGILVYSVPLFLYVCQCVFFLCFAAFRGQASFFLSESGRWDLLDLSGEKKTFYLIFLWSSIVYCSFRA